MNSFGAKDSERLFFSLPARLFVLFGGALLIVKTGCDIRPRQPAPTLPPDHCGCGLGYDGFTGTLPAVEGYARGCEVWLQCLLPGDLKRDILNGDEDELALPLFFVVEPLQHPLPVLQKARRKPLASSSLVASDEMLPLEPDDRRPAPSQKLPMLKQPT